MNDDARRDTADRAHQRLTIVGIDDHRRDARALQLRSAIR